MKNQYVTITPDLIDVNEFDTLTQQYTVEIVIPDEALVADPLIPTRYDYLVYDVLPDPSLPEWVKVETTQNSPTTFTVVCKLTDVFSRELSYIDVKDNVQVANYFSEMPVKFNAIFKYVPTAAKSKALSFTVRMYPENTPRHLVTEDMLHEYSIGLLVYSSYSIANQKFIEFVNNGEFAKKSAQRQ